MEDNKSEDSANNLQSTVNQNLDFRSNYSSRTRYGSYGTPITKYGF